MISETELPSLVAEIYQTGADFARWPQTLGRLATALGARSASMFRQGLGPEDSFGGSAGIDPACERDYVAYYHSVDPLWDASPITHDGAVLTDTMLIPRAEMIRTEFFQDFLRPQGIGGLLNAETRLEDGRRMAITVHGKVEWEGEQIALYRRLAPHLRAAVQLNARLARAEINQAVAGSVLDRLAQGVLFVEADARVIFANAVAEAAFSADGGLRLSDGVLEGGTGAETAALHATIARCGHSGLQAGADGLALSRDAGRAPLSVRVVPVAAAVPEWLGERPMAVIYVTDPDLAAKPAADALRAQFGLTRAQALLALEILDGDGIQAAADRPAITRATARTHLARVFEKTGTQRQSELVRVLMTGPLSPWRD